MDQLDDREVARPLMISGDNVPRRPLRCTTVNRVLVSFLVVLPKGTLFQIIHVELPSFFRIIETGLQPFFLFSLRNMQHELQDCGPILHEIFFETVDLVVAGFPNRLRDKLVHPHHQHILVV